MDTNQILKNIGQRCGGDIYLGVVGPVRSGKSTFIKITSPVWGGYFGNLSLRQPVSEPVPAGRDRRWAQDRI